MSDAIQDSTVKPAEPTTPAIDAKMLDDVKSLVIKQAELAFNQKLKEATGVESLEALIEAKKMEEEKKLKERGEYQKIADSKAAEAQLWREKYSESLSRQSILKACLDNNVVDEEAVLALVKSSTTVDDKGNVTIGGKPVDEAVKELLKVKQYLIKPTRTGSSSPSYPNPADDAKSKDDSDLQKILNSGDIQNAWKKVLGMSDLLTLRGN